jgi:putative addiction module CopG family antidote
MKTKTNKDQIEDAEYGLDSRFKSSKENESESALLMEARLLRMKNLSKDQIIRAKLMQLKLKTEEPLNIVSNRASGGRYKNVSEDIRAGLGLLKDEESKAINLRNAVSKGLESPRVENFNFDENLKQLKTKKSRQ